MRVSTIALVFLPLLSSCALVAQDISATIQGVVLDSSGKSVPNAKVSVILTDRNQTIRTITTDDNGSYSAPLIPIGTYQVKVEATGFKTFDQSGIILNVND